MTEVTGGFTGGSTGGFTTTGQFVPTITVIGELATVVKPVPPAFKVYAPATFKLILLNVATPATALTVVVPDKLPPTGADANESVMALVAVGIIVLVLSCNSTITSNGTPHSTLLMGGFGLNAKIGQLMPLFTVIEALVTVVKPVALALRVYAPTKSRLMLLNVATPFTALTVVVPDSTDPPGPDAIESVTASVAPVTTVFETSRISTVTSKFVAQVVVAVGGFGLNANV